MPHPARLATAIALAVLGCTSPPGRDAGRFDASSPADVPRETTVPERDAPDDGARADGSDAASTLYAYDLDGDGANDTNLTVVEGPLGLAVERATGSTTIPLPTGFLSSRAGVTMIGRPITVIGQHVGTALFEVAVLHQVDRTSHASPALSVVDVDGRSVVATASAPAALRRFESYDLASFSGTLREPDRRAPYLAPGYADAPAILWGYACVFRVGASGSRCGAGFTEIDTTVPTSFFREVGGLESDLDRDGYGDLSLIYHQRLRSFSGRSGALLADTEYDVALADEPGSPRWFHSGRNYGTMSFVPGTDGIDRTLIVGGAGVGTFTDYNCNVSRFLAVLDSPRGMPAARRLAWADYFGFGSSIFRTYSPAFASDPSADLSRLGDFTNGCIHRFGDSRVVVDGVPSIMVDYFVASGPVDTCLDEQYALYLDPPWTPDKVAAWNACISRTVSQTGRWGMQVRRLDTGASVTGSQDTYVWGTTDRLLPSSEAVYVVETLPPSVRFDVSEIAPSVLSVRALVGGLWVLRGSFPVAGRPRLSARAPEGDDAVGSFTALMDLDLTDRDGDGLAEVTLEGGDRVEWDGTAFVVVP